MNPIKYLLSVINIYFFCWQAIGQSTIPKLDKIKATSNTNSQIQAHLKNAAYYLNRSNYDSLFYHTQEALKLINVHDKTNLAQSYSYLGHYYKRIENYDESLKQHRKALTILEELNNNQNIKADCLANIGSIYEIKGEYTTASIYLFKALQIFHKKQNYIGEIYCNTLLGRIHYLLKDYTESIKYYEKSIVISKKFSAGSTIIQIMSGLGGVYLAIGDYGKSLNCFTEGLMMSEQYNNRSSAATFINNIGICHRFLKDLPKAISFHEKALKLRKEIGSATAIASCFRQLALDYLETNNNDKALTYALSADSIFKKQPTNEYYTANLNTLYQIYEKQGNYKLALQTFKKDKELKDSLYSNERYREILQVKNKAEIDNKLQQISFLEKINQIKQLELIKSQQKLRLADQQNILISKERELLLQQKELELLKNQSLQKYKDYFKKLSFLRKQSYNQAIHELSSIKTQRLLMYALSTMAIIACLLLYILFRQQIKFNKKIALQNKLLTTQSNELKELNETKDKLFSIIGHDLRSPIATIQQLLSNLTSISSFDAKGSLLNSLHQQVANTYNTLDNLLHWANRKIKKNTPQPRTISLKDSIEECLDLLDNFIQYKSISILNQLENYQLQIDEVLIQVVWRNILHNAIKFTPTGGYVSIKSTIEGNFIKVTIRDTGIGLTTLLRQNLFMNIQSQDGTDGEKGTGLGLIVCKELIESQGGKIEISGFPNRGTTVSILLPKT